MKPLGGFTQKQLDDIWDSLSSDIPHPSARKKVDDEAEQVMIIDTEDGKLIISRKPGEEWFDTPSVGDSSYV